MKKSFFLLAVLWLAFTSCSTLKIVDKPVVFDEERSTLTLEYLKERYDIHQEKPVIQPKMVVVHWTAISGLEKSYEAFYASTLPNWRPELKNAGALNVSSQFLIDQDGTVYRLMPETTMARHVIGLNHCAIGIENVGGTENTPLTKAQLKANVKVIQYLKKKYPEIEYVIGHFEYTNFDGTELWLEKDAAYRTEKTDPGLEFIAKIREKTSKYNWKPIPNKK